MKRDMDLVRHILVEMQNSESGRVSKLCFQDYSQEQIGHHVWLMAEAGLIEAAVNLHHPCGFPVATPVTIRWAGHEFLSAALDDTRWERAKAVAARAGNSGFPVLLEILTKLGLRQVGIELGP